MCQSTSHHRFRQWLVVWSMPSHYLNQWWNIVNWTLKKKLKFQSNFIYFHSRGCIWICRPQNGGQFVSASMRQITFPFITTNHIHSSHDVLRTPRLLVNMVVCVCMVALLITHLLINIEMALISMYTQTWDCGRIWLVRKWVHASTTCFPKYIWSHALMFQSFSLVTNNMTTVHYSDVMISAMVPQTTGVSIVYWTVCSSADQRKHQSSTSLIFVRGIHRWSVNFPHKGPVTRNMFPFDDVIMRSEYLCISALMYLFIVC